jgi:hypothetical protein
MTSEKQSAAARANRKLARQPDIAFEQNEPNRPHRAEPNASPVFPLSLITLPESTIYRLFKFPSCGPGMRHPVPVPLLRLKHDTAPRTA